MLIVFLATHEHGIGFGAATCFWYLMPPGAIERATAHPQPAVKRTQAGFRTKRFFFNKPPLLSVERPDWIVLR